MISLETGSQNFFLILNFRNFLIYCLLLFYLFFYKKYTLCYYYYFFFFLYFIYFYLYFTFSYLRLRFCFVTSFYILFSSPVNSINFGKQTERLQLSFSCPRVLAESDCVTKD